LPKLLKIAITVVPLSEVEDTWEKAAGKAASGFLDPLGHAGFLPCSVTEVAE
jgi:hypothetical protein